nr:MAG TPA: hypothetical protein [Caudoviricetes sp.]
MLACLTRRAGFPALNLFFSSQAAFFSASVLGSHPSRILFFDNFAVREYAPEGKMNFCV